MKPLTFKGRLLRTKTNLFLRSQNILLKTLGKIEPGTRSYSLVQKFLKDVVGGYPIAIKLDINDPCNLSYKTCYTKNNNRILSFENIRNILQQIGAVPLRLDILGGEPLRHPNLCDIIAYAKKSTKIKDVVLYTNGTLATASLTKKLAQSGLDTAIVTLISYQPDFHDEFTGQDGSWNATVEGVRRFKATGIKTNTFTAIHNKNIRDIQAISLFVRHELKVTPLFHQYIPQSDQDPLLPTPQQWNRAKNDMIKMMPKQYFSYPHNILTFCGRICLGGYYVYSIKVDGTITPCPFMQDIKLGNILKNNFWDSIAQKCNNSQMKTFLSIPDECQDCRYKNYCGGGCRAVNPSETADFKTKDCRCLGPWQVDMDPNQIPEHIPTFF
ncbi:MAG: radical SAM protein [Candidatus Omnitrophica bacterium]|nr:radical SAM protein [Candidatus Omnitrophota bacterium]